jgi:hypothetical protein
MTGRAWTNKTLQRARGKFLAALASGLSVTGAAGISGVGRATVYNWRESDEAFRAAWDDAIEAGTDRLEDEAHRRAHDGVEEPVVTMGRIARNDDGSMLVLRKYPDTLMCLLLKSRRPEKFRERVSTEVSGPDGGPVTLEALIAASYEPRRMAGPIQQSIAAPSSMAPKHSGGASLPRSRRPAEGR